jgi:UDP-N-acetylglucosamine:LPS N-acetylglucosamine transferase
MSDTLSEKKKLKVCLAASAGGHLSQLLKLSESWRDYDVVWITTSTLVKEKLRKYGKVYAVGECNREHIFLVLKVLLRCVKIILRERPDVVISTGAAVGCIMCFLGKLMRADIVWLDSITNVERISLSGRMVRCIADLFLVQWPQLTEQYKNVEYAGQVI